MYKQNLRTHGPLCDGRDAYEDTVRHAIDIGFDSIGFSAHSMMHYASERGMIDA